MAQRGAHVGAGGAGHSVQPRQLHGRALAEARAAADQLLALALDVRVEVAAADGACTQVHFICNTLQENYNVHGALWPCYFTVADPERGSSSLGAPVMVLAAACPNQSPGWYEHTRNRANASRQQDTDESQASQLDIYLPITLQEACMR